jgi:lipopolysaccharide biosynthesis glycosyltransferase
VNEHETTTGTTTIDAMCVFDEAYAMPAAVTLRSIARTLRPGERCTIHAVGDALSDESRARIESLATGELEIMWRDFDHSWLDRLPPEQRPRNSYLNDLVYVRLFLDDVLPAGVERLIFIDVDTLVRHSLADLWPVDLGDDVLAGVVDLGVPALGAPAGVTRWEAFGLRATSPYLNAGVLLVDRVRWREAELQRRTLEYLADPGNQISYYDQEAINACLDGQWARLPLAWNSQVASLEYILWSAKEWKGTQWLWSAVAPAEIDEAMRDPRVVHFAGALKPWLPEVKVPFRDEWLEVLEETPWAGSLPPRQHRAIRAAKLARRRLQAAVAGLRGR